MKISRRTFLETGAKGLALASIAPHLLQFNPKSALAGPMAQNMNLQNYLDYFGVTEAIIQEVMSAALSGGGDYCDLYFQHSLSNSVNLEDGAVNRANTNIDFGVGIRVLKGDQTGYSFTEEITPQAMKLAAKTAAAIADGAKKIDPVALTMHEHKNYYPVKTSWEEVGIDQKIPILQNINEKVFSLDARVIKSQIWFNDKSTYMLFANSEGRITFDYQPMGTIYVFTTAQQGEQREQNYSSRSVRRGMEFLGGDVQEALAREAVVSTTLLFDAVKPEAGEMEVVLAAGSSGILLHEAIGHGMEADFNRKEISIFSDKINKPVAESFVTIVDDGHDMNMRGSVNVDDEGNDTGRTYLVENGILRSYMHDRISANYYKVKPTGSGRRESFRFAPIPRMRNTYMLPGPHTRDEIVSSVKKGIYAESFTNGEVLIGAGDFTFYVKSGYLIEDGKLTKPIKDINIIGNGPQVLKDIVMVADDMKIDANGWTCGKNGQSMPVSLGLPTVKVSKITVGGVS